MMILCKLDNVYLFKNINHLIGWYSSHNPARQKNINLKEHETGGSPEDSTEKWAKVCALIYSTLELYPTGWRAAFNLYHKREGPLGPRDIAPLLRVNHRTVRRYLDEITEEIERRAMVLGWIPQS